MNKTYAKIVVGGSPISKSNFKLFNIKGRAILPYNSGKYHDRYALYEEQIAYEAMCQNPGTVIEEALIAVLKVYYKSRKRHPDTNNITKSIFDGIEKSGLIINDAQIRRIIIEEFYDKDNPRFELELFGESQYSIDYKVIKRTTCEKPILYSPPPNSKKNLKLFSRSTLKKADMKCSSSTSSVRCEICGKIVNSQDAIYGNKGSTIICKDCFNKLF
ncbi:MAG: RusA family crossover junction endodeoxyribonuclease [Clostridium sp.]|jgi:Holliday junction resolvase RusA-like endonuclease|uniref:RusA family crossover junction endodeoxyribonuclease n=1 Tax=Clostridium sp. TaxID=1506 RepID=UPI0025BBC75F|nr:RusA family crossover junction endodeoxyribonuclease [Clostridium sp.]MCH3966011.1 RusA family crossover junction endodeoxyribonuclease [Clostridium sp.]MCI1715901.1 RusA family crossover junction endodeoxyribonuclease [Clostridium sp.]MCI1800427.1 RusA family crossover junction endodeoxyribonuclease [Clostridium sp.]MCI1814078.1 RusA family crossover junction endodeoxyribonuclease [Clostridium sp.]MCI1870976.1 RusA family crossover junction endodeoxyribonuclease [Clostridium sp.]